MGNWFLKKSNFLDKRHLQIAPNKFSNSQKHRKLFILIKPSSYRQRKCLLVRQSDTFIWAYYIQCLNQISKLLNRLPNMLFTSTRSTADCFWQILVNVIINVIWRRTYISINVQWIFYDVLCLEKCDEGY